MIRLVTFEQPNATLLSRGAIQIDIDPAAERYILLDRRTLLPLKIGFRPATGIVKFIVPFEYTIGFNLMAFIVDDAGEPAYNVVGADKIQAELVDAKTVVLSV